MISTSGTVSVADLWFKWYYVYVPSAIFHVKVRSPCQFQPVTPCDVLFLLFPQFERKYEYKRKGASSPHFRSTAARVTLVRAIQYAPTFQFCSSICECQFPPETKVKKKTQVFSHAACRMLS